MYLDHRYRKPSDNPLRVILYALAAVLIVYTVLIAAHAALAGNRADDGGGYGSKADTAATSSSRGWWGGWWRDATSMGVGTDQSNSPNRDTCSCTNSLGRLSGPV